MHLAHGAKSGQAGPHASHIARYLLGRKTMTTETACAPDESAPEIIGQISDDSVIIDLATRARDGDARAWDALVERYAPLIWSLCRRYRLDSADAEDVGQSVWLRLLDQLDKIRDPAAVAGWIATTTRRECLRVVRAAGSHPVSFPLDAERIADEQSGLAEELVLAAERQAALREAYAELPTDCQRLVAMLIADPPMPYTEISTMLSMPIGSIGPTRSRCLDKMRRHPAIAALDARAAHSPRLAKAS
jgi:RNA polymerase sigma factor (sigma-70 family)